MMATRCFKLAALYLILGLTLGVVMGATHQFTLSPVHAHINLLGWTLLVLAGLLYTRFPQLAETRLGKAFFWIFNLALPLFATLLGLVLLGQRWMEPLLGMASVAVWSGGVCLALNLLLNLREADVRR